MFARLAIPLAVGAARPHTHEAAGTKRPEAGVSTARRSVGFVQMPHMLIYSLIHKMTGVYTITYCNFTIKVV